MIVQKTKIKGLLVIKNNHYLDGRGYFKEIFKENKVKQKIPFLVMSFSKKNVLRGIHIQQRKSQGKYLTVLKGKIFDVAVDLRPHSKTFGKHFSIILSEKNKKSLFIPAGFGHGFCSLDKENYVIYGCTKYRDKNSEKGIKWNDQELKIKWPIKNLLISNKDQNNITFKAYRKMIKK